MGIKITDLPTVTSLELGDYLPIVDESGTPTTSKTTVGTLRSFVVGNYSTLNSSSNGNVLTTSFLYYFVDNSEGFNIYLPAVASMIGIPITFVTTQNQGETWFSIATNDGSQIQEGSSYYMAGPNSLTLISDGSNWWIIGSH